MPDPGLTRVGIPKMQSERRHRRVREIGAALQALDTLREMFGVGDGDEVVTKLFPSTHRGGTAANPEYLAEDR